MSYKITTNQGVEFDCLEGDTLLLAALRAGVAFPYECNSGGCGTCKFEATSGNVLNRWQDAPGLSDRDKSKNRQLACQCVPQSDCEIKVRLKSDVVPEIPPVKHTARLYKVKRITDEMSEFCFKTDGVAFFKAGQFALLDIPGVQGPRAYSMSNLANDENEWHFIIKKVPTGKASSQLFETMRVGDSVQLDGPFGFAYLKPGIKRDIVCVAGGSGISPEMAIIKAAVKEKDVENRKTYLFYGAASPSDICTPSLLKSEAGLFERVINFNAVSDSRAAKAEGWTGDVGFIHELLKNKLAKTLTEHEFYICGPPAMTNALTQMLVVEFKVPIQQIHFDRFY